MTGTIKTKTDKGFGFIARDGEDNDLFFHSNDVEETTFEELEEGQTVTFELGQSDKGPRAEHVKPA